LKELINDDKYWFDINTLKNDLPLPIKMEYEFLKQLAFEEDVYGVFLESRDLCEVIIKIPILFSLVYLNNNKELIDDNTKKNLVTKFLQRLSMGNWYHLMVYLLKLCELNQISLPENLIIILKKTQILYDTRIGSFDNINNWRNATIGHGSLRFKNDANFQKEIKDIFRALKKYFSEDDEKTNLYEKIKLFIEPSDENKIKEKQQIKLRINDEEISVTDFIENFSVDNYTNCMFFYDSFDNRKNNSHFTRYIPGTIIKDKNNFFNGLYKQYVFKNISENKISKIKPI